MSTYTPISLTEMRQILHPDKGWTLTDLSASNVNEHVLDWPIPDLPNLSIRVYTSIDLTTDLTRPVGADAIRVCVPKRLKSTRVLRVAGWRANLQAAVRSVLATIREMEAKKQGRVDAYTKTLLVNTAEAMKALHQPLDYSPIHAMLTKASEHLKYPKVKLNRDGADVQFKLAGPLSKYHGSVLVTDGKPFGQNLWFGTIDGSGVWLRSKQVTPIVEKLVTDFAKDPAGVAAECGFKTGACSFCGRSLSHDNSLAVGYGPVCAERFALPWGAPA